MVEPAAPAVSEKDRAELTWLEEAMWREQTRFDAAFMERTLAPDFFEYGRSGRIYTREQTLAAPRGPIDVVLPLPRLAIRLLDAGTAQVTYDSIATCDGDVEFAHRSSIWSRTADGWVLRFHQGTAFLP